MKPSKPLPFPSHFADVDVYIESLLFFATSSEIFQSLCGGVHVLEFLTREPDLYASLLPEEWRQFFDGHDVSDILDLLMRFDLSTFSRSQAYSNQQEDTGWRSGRIPPSSLLKYIKLVRQHSLNRNLASSKAFPAPSSEISWARQVAVGMKPKKLHEVLRLARYVDNLSSELSSDGDCQISHIVDFGSGQNYLGRTLASPPYEKKVIAIESKLLNINEARSMDVIAKLAKKEVVMQNKKQYRSHIEGAQRLSRSSNIAPGSIDMPASPIAKSDLGSGDPLSQEDDRENNIQYIETMIQNGDLSSVLSRLPKNSYPQFAGLMVISLHSCGNLIHHGLRSLTLNPSVRAIALVGCCYNLLTERLPPPRHPQSNLRSSHPRLQQTSSECDPHGFPMSERFLKYPHQHGPGIRFNITARMMAVQAPQNWTEKDYESFFTRHFYRALFQRILADRGVVESDIHTENMKGKNASEQSEGSKPIILGSLRKQCYTSFIAYVRAAIAKLKNDPVHAEKITEGMEGLTDEEIVQYEQDFGHKKKELSIVWSLMAFSAGVVESAIVVDRWQWLREQEEVKDCWVESIFNYSISPRNLVVVGIKG